MTSSLRVARSVFLSTVVAVALLIGGCDVFGSDSDDAPAWVGNWEAVDAKPDSVEYPPDGTRILFSISTDSIKSYVQFSNGECETDATGIVSVDGNVVTTEDGETDETETRLEVSGNTLTITPLGSDADFEEITAESVDSNPRGILDCSSSSNQANTTKTALFWDR